MIYSKCYHSRSRIKLKGLRAYRRKPKPMDDRYIWKEPVYAVMSNQYIICNIHIPTQIDFTFAQNYETSINVCISVGMYALRWPVASHIHTVCIVDDEERKKMRKRCTHSLCTYIPINNRHQNIVHLLRQTCIMHIALNFRIKYNASHSRQRFDFNSNILT